MKYFYLIRHGEKQAAWGDPALTPIGHQQAERTGHFLSTLPITQVLASPRLRTQQTAAAIAKPHQLSVLTHDLLRERIDFLDGSRFSLSTFQEHWQKGSTDRQYAPPGEDSSITTGQRLQTVIESQLTTEHQHIVLVTHGGSISDFIRNVFDDTVIAQHTVERAYGHDYRVSECSITTISTDGKTFALHGLVQTDHLRLPK